MILSVDDAWKEFALENSMTPPFLGLRCNYLDLCYVVSGLEAEDARRAATSIRAVLGGRMQQASMEYPCHSPTEERWFRMSVARLKIDRQSSGTGGAGVLHINISERKRVELAAQDEQRLVVKVFEQSGEALMITDAHCKII